MVTPGHTSAMNVIYVVQQSQKRISVISNGAQAAKQHNYEGAHMRVIDKYQCYLGQFRDSET